jgi:thioredoxin-related protein
MVKKIFLIVLVATAIWSPVRAQQGFNEILSAAKHSGKNVLIVFSGSDWCIPCIKMEKQVFMDDQFKQYATDHLVVVHADFPRLKKNQLSKEQQSFNESLADKYNTQGSFPMTVLTDAQGKVLKEWPGYKDDLTASLFIKQAESATHGGN